MRRNHHCEHCIGCVDSFVQHHVVHPGCASATTWLPTLLAMNTVFCPTCLSHHSHSFRPFRLALLCFALCHPFVHPALLQQSHCTNDVRGLLLHVQQAGFGGVVVVAKLHSVVGGPCLPTTEAVFGWHEFFVIHLPTHSTFAPLPVPWGRGERL